MNRQFVMYSATGLLLTAVLWFLFGSVFGKAFMKNPGGFGFAQGMNPKPSSFLAGTPDNTLPDRQSGFVASVPDMQSDIQGVQPVNRDRLHQLFPQAKEKPLLIEFRSKFCLDCQRMAPVMEKLFRRYPRLQTFIFDIHADRKAYPAVFEAFQPNIVPILIFVRPDGTTYRVLYGFQSQEMLTQTLNNLYNTPSPSSSKAIKKSLEKSNVNR